MICDNPLVVVACRVVCDYNIGIQVMYGDFIISIHGL